MTPMPVDLPLQAPPYRPTLLVDILLSTPNRATPRACRTVLPQALLNLRQNTHHLPFGVYTPRPRHTRTRPFGTDTPQDAIRTRI